MTRAGLRGLLLDSLRLWDRPGQAEWHGDHLHITASPGPTVLVRAASPAEYPARWFLQTEGGRPPRPTASVTGLLAALRTALDAGQAATRLRIAVSPRDAGLPSPAPGQAPPPPPGAVPVLVVTGFLGSGKTTLIQRLLRNPAFTRTAVIVNEFGEIGLDHALIASSTETLVQLTTGCLCCAVRGDLLATLLDLDAQRRNGTAAFDRVVIETSGLADPAPILHGLMTDPAVATAYTLSGVLTLVDTVHGPASLARHPEARRQAALADRILLTKTDTAPASDELRATLATLNPLATLAAAVHGDVSPDWLFAPSVTPPRTWDGPLAAEHTAGIGSTVLTPSEPVPAAALALLLQALAEQAGDRLLRVKGLVSVAEQPDRPALVHGVGHVFEAPDWLDRWPDDDRRTRLVLIAISLPPRWPTRLLQAITAEVLDVAARTAAERTPQLAGLPG